MMSSLSNLTIDQWIATGSSLGTLLAAILAFFSIREIRKQREQQFLPRLTPSTGLFNVHLSDILWWELPDADEVENLPKATNDKFRLPLINVGNGAATDVRISWDVDIEEWAQKVNTLSAQTGAGIGVSIEDGWVTYLRDGVAKGSAALPEACDQNLEYVLPVSSSTSGVGIEIPPAIKLLMQAYYRCYFSNKGGREFERNPSPEFRIDLKLEFKDTAGKQFKRRSILNVSALCASSSPDDASQLVSYILSPSRTEPAQGDSIAMKAALEVVKLAAGRLTPFPIR